jgi:hypothetical protein
MHIEQLARAPRNAVSADFLEQTQRGVKVVTKLSSRDGRGTHFLLLNVVNECIGDLATIGVADVMTPV